ncbi:hypothetical protein FQN53_002030 [Emmonsiellopsis sp. PD_33]|nr:hypothetical protein FQN53_002030 [Emmonsiellopsis sp. PD_33]
MFRPPCALARALPRGGLRQTNPISSTPRIDPVLRTRSSPAKRTFFRRASSAAPPVDKAEKTLSWRFDLLLDLVLFGGAGYFMPDLFLWDKVLRPPGPGSAEDVMELKILREKVAWLPIVQELRADPEYEEWEAYEDFEEEEKPHRLTSGPMSGSKGLGVQRIFWNERRHEAVTVVYFGDALTGWPRKTHGGAIATVLDESLGRVAIRSFPARAGVTANLDIDYRKPVNAGYFYTVTAKYDNENSTERKAVVSGEVRDIDGTLCAEAKGLFVVPKKFTLKPLGRF